MFLAIARHATATLPFAHPKDIGTHAIHERPHLLVLPSLKHIFQKRFVLTVLEMSFLEMVAKRMSEWPQQLHDHGNRLVA